MHIYIVGSNKCNGMWIYIGVSGRGGALFYDTEEPETQIYLLFDIDSFN